MKKISIVIFSLLFFILSGKQIIAKSFYNTFEAIEVTENTVTLQRKKGSKVIKATINRSRRPYLKVGDRVRYDKKKDRLRRTLKKKK